MNAFFSKKTFRTAIVAAAAITSLAGLAGRVQADEAAPGRTRAEVMAEVLAAKASRQMGIDLIDDPFELRLVGGTHTAGRSRAEVVAETLAALRSGELSAMQGEDSGAMHLARAPWASGRTRAEVRGETVAALRSGEAFAMYGEDSGSFHLARVNPRGDEAVRLATVSR